MMIETPSSGSRLAMCRAWLAGCRPPFAWAKGYDVAASLKGDLTAGVVVGAMLIPQACFFATMRRR